MEDKIINIFVELWLEKVIEIKKIDIWFTNDIFIVNDKYIIKICKKSGNQKNFEKEVFLYNLFSDKILVPKILYYDKSKKLINKHYYICNKIEGDNLYSVWHLLKETERKKFIKELCEILKIINSYWIDEYKNKYWVNENFNWESQIISDLKKYLKKIEEKKFLEDELINKIKKYITENKGILKDKKVAIVYWDAHFDNILVKNWKIVWILDFEWMELLSIDYILDLIFRMEKYPHVYVSNEENEKLINIEDYRNMVSYYKEFYPELFDFKFINKRVAIYSIRYDLKLILDYPHVKSLRKRLMDNLNI